MHLKGSGLDVRLTSGPAFRGGDESRVIRGLGRLEIEGGFEFDGFGSIEERHLRRDFQVHCYGGGENRKASAGEGGGRDDGVEGGIGVGQVWNLSFNKAR